MHPRSGMTTVGWSAELCRLRRSGAEAFERRNGVVDSRHATMR
jgi:hypothetical protein